jgi:putative sigma-54 modulation protein
MTLIVRSQVFPLTEAIHAHLERRFTAALKQFDDRITRITIFLKDLNGAGKGGEDKCVLVNIQLPAQAPVIVETISNDLYSAINIAARRTGRTVKRALCRQQRFDQRETRRLRLGGAAANELYPAG